MPTTELGLIAKFGSYIYATLSAAFVAGMSWVALKLTVKHHKELNEKDLATVKMEVDKDIESSTNLVNQRIETLQNDFKRLEDNASALTKEVRASNNSTIEMKGLLKQALNELGKGQQ